MQAELLLRYGDFELYDSAFDHLGAGAFLRDHIDDVETVEDATKANQPGNLIFFEDEVPCRGFCGWGPGRIGC